MRFFIGWIGGNLGVSGGNNLARNDEINLYDAEGGLVDRLTYGDQTYAGTIRTQNASGQACREAIGQDDVAAWVLSASGDRFGTVLSAAGERGTPGSYDGEACNPCIAPSITTSPVEQVVCSSAEASFSVIAAGTGPLGYAWQIEQPAGSGTYVNLTDSVVAGLGTVSGSGSAALTISSLGSSAVASVRCVVTNACGEAASGAASLRACAADFNCDGFLDFFDYDAYVSAFETGC